jgi:hypothetical protein
MNMGGGLIGNPFPTSHAKITEPTEMISLKIECIEILKSLCDHGFHRKRIRTILLDIFLPKNSSDLDSEKPSWAAPG